MSSDESYLPEFFTPERLEWYRSLTQRFPLWCGNWPKDLLWHPKAQEWSLDALAHREFEEEGAEESIILIEFHGLPTTTAVSSPFTVVYQEPEDEWSDPYIRVPGVEPIVFGALFASINYLSHRWEADGKAVRLHDLGWSDLVELLPRIRGVMEKKQFLRRRKDYMAGDFTRRELQQIWNDIGEDLGLIPDDHQGQTSAMLDDEDLKALHEEGMELVAKFREVAAESDSGEVAKLQLTYPEDFPELTVLSEALSDPSRDWVKKILKGRLERHGAELDLDYWVQRLRFPMLRREEVRVLLDAPTKKPKPLAREFLAQRVGLSPDTLANKGI